MIPSIIDNGHAGGAAGMVSGKNAQKDDQKINYDSENDKTWDSKATNHDWISLAHLSNSFIILMALDEIKKPVTAGEISEFIALSSQTIADTGIFNYGLKDDIQRVLSNVSTIIEL